MAGRTRRAQGNVPPGRALYEHNGKGDADKADSQIADSLFDADGDLHVCDEIQP
jgi:hypothetical protein